MRTLQVRDLPEDVYTRLKSLADKEHRSLTQETIVLLEEAIQERSASTDRKRALLEKDDPLGLEGKRVSDPVILVREDRDR